MPAEWASHSTTWLTWPLSQDWPGKLRSIRWTYCELIRLLQRSETVTVIVPGPKQIQHVRQAVNAAGGDGAALQFYQARTNRTWARDKLPLFVTKDSAQRGPAVGTVKFRFNGWARYEDHQLDEAAGMRIATSHGGPTWVPTAGRGRQARRLVLEGGSIDVDGEGTILTTRRCLLGSPYTRNPGMRQQEAETMLREFLGATHTVWLEDGIDGDDTSGHVDDFARFVGPGRVVCASETNSGDSNYAPLQAAREQLTAARDARGARLDVVELPMPDPVYFRGKRLPASYANFYIANGQVLVPVFNDPKDAKALGIVGELFPEREVIGVYARDLVLGLGTLHCSTMQEPAAPARLSAGSASSI